MKIDSSRLQDVVRSNIETLCRHFFPNGKKDGAEWKIADVSGAKGESLGICLLANKAGVWLDRATGDKGNFTQLLMRSRNLAFDAAAAEIGRCLGIDLDGHFQNGVCIDWNSCRKLTQEQEQRMASWRGYSRDFVHWLSENDLLRAYGENGNSRWVFPVHLGGKVAGTHSRPIEWNGSGRRDWLTLPRKKDGGPGVQPQILGQLEGATAAHISESTWDTLALCDKLGVHKTDGFVALCTRGAGNDQLASALPNSVREVFLWPQNDEAGRAWAAKVVPHLPKSAVTKVVRTPAKYADLNDWVRDGATADDLFRAIKNAEATKSNQADELWIPESLVALSDENMDPSQTLLGNRWLEREQSLIVVGPSGVGKSVWAIQLSFLVAAGLSPFQIPTYAPRKILIIQAEDNKNDRIEMAHMLHELQLSTEQKALAHRNAQIVSVNNVCGAGFLRHLAGNLHAFQEQGFCPDIIVINPLTSYLGGDETKPDVCNTFLRTGLNPILCRYKCATIILHHPPKTTHNSTENFNYYDWQYRGAGSAHITNWARATLAIEPSGTEHVFKLIAGKRAERIGWNSREIFLAHSREAGRLLWVPATAEQIASAKTASAHGSNDLLPLIPALDPISQDRFFEECKQKLHGMGVNKARQLVNILIDERKVFIHKIPREGAKSAVGYAKTQPRTTNEEEC